VSANHDHIYVHLSVHLSVCHTLHCTLHLCCFFFYRKCILKIGNSVHFAFNFILTLVVLRFNMTLCSIFNAHCITFGYFGTLVSCSTLYHLFHYHTTDISLQFATLSSSLVTICVCWHQQCKEIVTLCQFVTHPNPLQTIPDLQIIIQNHPIILSRTPLMMLA